MIFSDRVQRSLNKFISTGCYKVPVYENTIVEVQTGQLHKDTITFACVPGYLLRGNPTITCTHNGLWSKKKFTCEGKCFYILV